MSAARADVVLLAPEHEMVPEHSVHNEVVSLLYAGLRAAFSGRDDVAVHARLGWFPDRHDTRIRLDPDVAVTFGRPFEYRSSWRTWDEHGAVPQVILEVWSDDESSADYRDRMECFHRYGTAEVVFVDPFAVGGVRVERLVRAERGWETAAVSASSSRVVRVARLGIDLAGGGDLVVRDHRGVWPTVAQAFARAGSAAGRACIETARAGTEAARADAAAARADAAAARAERLATKLRALGVDPDDV